MPRKTDGISMGTGEPCTTGRCTSGESTIPTETNSNDFGVFGINRFEFDFRRRGNYLFEGFEFLVCSKVNHTHHVAVNVHVLWPVCTHTIPCRMLWCL